MSWTAYKVTLQLCSPLHIGAGKLGNLQYSRTYITGRNLWGALTSRLTRDAHTLSAPLPQAYQDMGRSLPNKLAFTYFFPTTDPTGRQALFPHLDSRGSLGYGRQANGLPQMSTSAFRYRMVSTYAGTALEPSACRAEDASLHEVECLTHYTRDGGEPVYLTGYVFQAENCELGWWDAFDRLQIGGERGYGWGRIKTEGKPVLWDGKSLFGEQVDARPGFWPPVLEAKRGGCLLAHTLASSFQELGIVHGVNGPVEPLVGRETRLDTRFGVHLSKASICYAPGSRLAMDASFRIGHYGIWEALP